MSRPERFINSLSFQYLTQSIELDLSNIHGRGMFPSKKEINSFIMNEMSIGPGVLRGVQHHPRFPKVHLQFLKDEDMLVAELKVKDGLMMQSKKIKIFGYRCDKPMVTIVLNGQDMDIKEDEIKRVLEKYGKVVTCERGRNVDLSTSEHFVTDGTWTVRMTPEITTKPPETIYYFGPSGAVQTWVLTYDGVGSSCILCGVQGHMGFRCNSLVPRGGRLGRKPAGMGYWTDVVECLAPAVQQPAARDEGEGGEGHVQEQQPAQVGGEHLRERVPPAGVPKGAPVLPDRNAIFAKAKQQGTGFSASQPWGSGPPMVEKRVSLLPAIPGLADLEQKWQKKKLQNKKKNERRKEKRKLEGVSTHNPFDALKDNDHGSDWESEEEIVEKKKVQPRVLRVGRMTSALGAYGARRTLPLVSYFKKTANEKLPSSKKVDKKKKKEAKEDSKKRRGSINLNEMEQKKTKTSSEDDVPDDKEKNDDEDNEQLTEESAKPDERSDEMEDMNKDEGIVEEGEVVEDLPVLDDVLPGDVLDDVLPGDGVDDVLPDDGVDEEVNKLDDSIDKVSEDDTEPSLPSESIPSSIPASVNLLAGHNDAGSTQLTQDNRDEYGQSGAVSELSLPSSVPSSNLLIPSQSTQDNGGGYAQSLGASQPSLTFGAGGSGVNTGSTFAGTQSQPFQTMSEEELEIKQKAEMIRSQLESTEEKDMSSSSQS